MPKYSVEYKKRVVDDYKKNGKTYCVKKYGHSSSVIYRWVRKSETVGFVRKKSKTYTPKEKLEILNYYFKNGFSETSRKYDVNSGLIFTWERKYREYGLEGLSIDGRGRPRKGLPPKKNLNTDLDLLAENQRLRIELEYLKKLDTLVQEREERERKKK